MGGDERRPLHAGLPRSPHEVEALYRVELLVGAEVGERGVQHRIGADAQLLDWGRVEHALAAEVGEPEGVRTVVFDLLVERKPNECLVVRFAADPGDDAQLVASLIERHVDAERCSVSLHELAAEGIPTRWYPDLVSLAEDALDELGY
ncbi:MAG: hypothetical protein QNK03_08000 [Myxococcota bacterium]|nr:hypothetical protein [Myxococcota bacterium]